MTRVLGVAKTSASGGDFDRPQVAISIGPCRLAPANLEADPGELQRRFVEKHWPKCVAYARMSLEEMLKRPDVPETAKAQIIDVLAKDDAVARGRCG